MDLEISSLGFEGQTIQVSSESQVISLSLSTGEALDEVVISGSRKAEKAINAASSIQILGAKEIENKSAFNSFRFFNFKPSCIQELTLVEILIGAIKIFICSFEILL